MKYREVIPLKQQPDWVVTLPGSKSITNRIFLCSALAKGKSKIYGALRSDDADVMLEALKKVGIKIRETRLRSASDGQDKNYIEITGKGGKFDSCKRTLDLHNAGTSTRFLTAVMTLREGETIITGDKRMQERPIADLVDGLLQMGVSIEYLKKEGCPPLRITNCELRVTNSKQYVVRMKGDKSSQYFSALLMMAPCLDKPLKIEVVGDLVSKPYIDITLSVLKQFGIRVRNNNYKSFTIRPQAYKAGEYLVEGDASGASYWTSVAYLHGGRVKFLNLNLSKSIQGDANFEHALKELQVKSHELRVIDMNAMPDAAMTLAVTAPFAKGKTKITGLSTLRIKETDRIAALENEMKKIGIKVKTTKDSITISSSVSPTTSPTISPTIRTYNDHRMAMCFAVLGTKIPGIVVENPACTDKTYPNFWRDLELVYLTPIKLRQKNLILTGMRCSGKTYLGKKIAKLMKRKFVDLDDEIEKSEKMKVKDIVKRYGWSYFRKVEQKMCSVFGAQKNLVIATGGGVILDEKNMKALKKNGINVFTFTDPSVIIERIKKQSKNRPTLTGKGSVKEVKKVWKERRNLYLKYADYTWDDTSGDIIKNSLNKIFV